MKINIKRYIRRDIFFKTKNTDDYYYYSIGYNNY